MGEDPEEIIIPKEDQSRQAIAAIGGYSYQLFASADAWLRLEDQEVLLLEVAEDYAVLARSALEATQVKYTSTPVTLRTPSVVKTINAFWRFKIANIDLDVRSVYLTTSRIGKERNTKFPGGVSGLNLWRDAIGDQNVLPSLRTFLLDLPLSKELSTWLKVANDDDVCRKFLSRIDWRCGAPPVRELEVRIRERIRKRSQISGALPSEGDRATEAVIGDLLKVASSPGTRELRRSQLDEIIERATTCAVPASTMRRLFTSEDLHSGRTATPVEYSPPLTLRENEGGERLFFFAAEGRVPLAGRNSEFSTLKKWLEGDEKFSWTLLTGPAGAGKSRLALELCIYARGLGWHAGFFHYGSELTKAEHFANFRGSDPTLIVWDYVIEAPDDAKRVLDTLLASHQMGVFNRPVRILLVERTRSANEWWRSLDHKGRLGAHFSALGSDGKNLDLQPLNNEALQEIVGYVLKEEVGSEEVIGDLEQIDPLGRPLFAALAADAIRNGREASKMSQQALLNDIIDREQFRWRLLARSAFDLEIHENALALATLIGGLQVPQAAQGLPLQAFPFSPQSFNSSLMEEMTQRATLTAEIPPIEPDLVGEWFVIQRLIPSHPFDERPNQILLAAESRALLSADAAAELGFFRTRAAEDFPNELVQTKLFRVPAEGAPVHAFIEWVNSVSQSFQYMADLPHVADQWFSSIGDFVETLSSNADFQMAASDAYFNYAFFLIDQDRLVDAKKIITEMLDRASKRTDLPNLAHTAAQIGSILGEQYLRVKKLQEALDIFKLLLSFARDVDLERDWKDEAIDCAASLGLSIRLNLSKSGAFEAVRALDKRLWKKPINDGSIDIVSNAGCILMQRDDLGSAEDRFHELKVRSLARTDVKTVAFWAANVAYGMVRDAKDNQTLVDATRELADWIAPREDWSHIGEVVDEAINNEWITEQFALGRKPLEALFQLWSAAALMAKKHGEVARNNEVHHLREEIEEALACHGQEPWVVELRQRIRSVETEIRT